MRISDWSSGVCSSDLPLPDDELVRLQVAEDENRVMQSAPKTKQASNETALLDTLTRMARTIEERASQQDTQPLKSESTSLETGGIDRKSTRLNSSHYCAHRMPSHA